MTMKNTGWRVANHFKLSTGLADYTNVSTRPTNVYGIDAFNISTVTLAYLKLYDISSVASSATSTAATSLPTGVWLVPISVTGSTLVAGAGFVKDFPEGWNLNNGLAYSIVTGIANTSTVAVAAAEVVVNIQYETSTN